MASVNLLSRGNQKLGESIFQFSIPALDTCPGHTILCSQRCYARQGRFNTDGMRQRLSDHYDATLRQDFVRRIVKEVNRRGVYVLRIHVAGDFHSPEYLDKWTAIAERCPRTTLYAYTRSWRCSEFKDSLAAFAALDNTHLWYSADCESGLPDDIPPRVRIAFMQTVVDEDPGDVQLVFKIHDLRGTRSTRIPLGLICPTEQGKPNTDRTCTSCRRCYSE